jgi:hypothetical protein
LEIILEEPSNAYQLGYSTLMNDVKTKAILGTLPCRDAKTGSIARMALDSSRESSVIAGLDEQTHAADQQDWELASLQQIAASGLAEPPLQRLCPDMFSFRSR